MPSNKKRLYVALYPSGVSNNEERKYHWGFLIGPKEEERQDEGMKAIPGMRYHVKNSPAGWKYEELGEDVRNANSLLALIVIAKIKDEKRLISLFNRVPVVQGDPNWRCRTWMASALDEIAKDGNCVGTAELSWPKIEAFGRQYVGNKTSGGRYRSAADLVSPRPTWDMLENEERIS